MHATQVFQYQTPDELAAAAAAKWLDKLRSHPPDVKGGYAVAVSGGRIAGNFFRAIARLGAKDPRLFTNVDWFWADERCVPPTDPESNYKLCHELMLAPLGIPNDRVHRIAGDVAPATGASQAEADWKTFANRVRRGAKPYFDIIFLGMGEDGHVASLFPDTRESGPPGRTYRAVTGPKPPIHRVTLGYPELAAAKEVWVLVSGVGKHKPLEAALRGTNPNPLARLIASRVRTVVFTDATTDSPVSPAGP
jgi:6-phosphogluconolactonase